jgi:hypothetical protein
VVDIVAGRVGIPQPEAMFAPMAIHLCTNGADAMIPGCDELIATGRPCSASDRCSATAGAPSPSVTLVRHLNHTRIP